MAAPTPVGTSAVTIDTASATSTTADLPTGIQVGEVLRMVVVGSATDSTPNTAATGWTKQRDVVFTSSTGHGALFRRVADGTEGSTIAVTTDLAEDRVVIIWRESGWDGSTADEHAIFIGTTSPFVCDPPSLSPSWTPADGPPTLVYAIGFQDSTAGDVQAVPTGYTNLAGGLTNTLLGGSVRVGYKVVTADTEDPGEFTIGSTAARTSAITLAVAGVAAITQSVAGSITPTGDVTEFGIGMDDMAGSIIPTSTLANEAQGYTALGFGGSIEPVGLLDQNVFTDYGGSITPTGALQIGGQSILLDGVLVPEGIGFASEVTQNHVGSITPSGALFLSAGGGGGGGNYEKWRRWWHNRRRRS